MLPCGRGDDLAAATYTVNASASGAFDFQDLCGVIVSGVSDDRLGQAYFGRNRGHGGRKLAPVACVADNVGRQH